MKRLVLFLGLSTLLLITVTAPTSADHMGLFQIFGTAQDAQDPENPANDVLKIDTTGGGIGGAFLRLNLRSGPGDPAIERLDNQLAVKYFFITRTCAGGSPRFQVMIDGDGDGDWVQTPGGPDQNAFGYVGDVPFGGGCSPGAWVFEDMTNDTAKWDLSQFGGSMTSRWSAVETAIAGDFPNHRIVGVVLADDSGGFAPTAAGVAFYELIIGERALLDRLDTGRP